MKMKQIIASLALCVVASLAFVGCSTTGAGSTTPTSSFIVVNTNANTVTVGGLVTINPQSTGLALQNLIEAGVPPLVVKYPDTRAYFEGVELGMGLALNNGDFSPTNLEADMNSVSINELHNADVQSLVTSVGSLYEVFFGNIVTANLDANVWAKPVVTDMYVGLCTSLGDPVNISGSIVMTNTPTVNTNSP